MMHWTWGRVRINWNSHLSLTGSNFSDAGHLRDKLALLTMELPMHVVQYSEMLKKEILEELKEPLAQLLPLANKVSQQIRTICVNCHSACTDVQSVETVALLLLGSKSCR